MKVSLNLFCDGSCITAGSMVLCGQGLHVVAIVVVVVVTVIVVGISLILVVVERMMLVIMQELCLTVEIFDAVIVTVVLAGVREMFVMGVGEPEPNSVAIGESEGIGYIDGHTGAVGAS